jgi:hypothetical protein
LERHEVQEWFRFKGTPVVPPHPEDDDFALSPPGWYRR